MRMLVGLVAIFSCVAPARAHAQGERIELRAEGLVGGQLADLQRDDLGFEAGLAATFRPGFRVVDALAIQLALGGQWFPSDRGTGQLFVLGGGLRLEPRVGDVGRFFVDANANYGLTGELSRFTLDFGVGFEFRLHELFSLGPSIRYSHLFAGEGDVEQDAVSLWGGLSVVVRLGEDPQVEPPPIDTDDDGVIDGRDLCPNIHHGDTPDPARIGCPLEDRDEDGVPDRDDVCADTPEGEFPDVERPGCPQGDADEDGVLDGTDQCPSTPAGDVADPERPGCPAPDTDSDAVLDPQDQCPRTHQGPHPDPERAGCPLPDGDNDMVPDRDDACPERPGAPSTDPARNGCPSLVQIEGNMIHINRPVFFATARDRILPRSRRVLEALVDLLRASPFIRRVSIEGHTDDVGDDADNLDLSNRRAHSVLTWLVEHGVEPDRLEAHGFGETRPIVPETNRRARAVNRRVEFQILDPAPPERQAPAVETEAQ